MQEFRQLADLPAGQQCTCAPSPLGCLLTTTAEAMPIGISRAFRAHHPETGKFAGLLRPCRLPAPIGGPCALAQIRKFTNPPQALRKRLASLANRA